MRGRRCRPSRARTLVDERRGRTSYAAIGLAIGESDRWVSDLLAKRSYTRWLPSADQINRLAGHLDIPPATLLVALAADRGLEGDDVTPRHVAMGDAFRQLSPAGQRVALDTVRSMGRIPGLAAHTSLRK